MFNVVVTSATPDDRIRSIKAIRSIHVLVNGTPLGLKEGRDIFDDAVDGKSSLLVQSHDEMVANGAKGFLAAFGILSEVKEPDVTIPAKIVRDAIKALELVGLFDQADALSGRTAR